MVYDQSELIDPRSRGWARRSAGALFVVLVLFALLGDGRAALVVTLTLPSPWRWPAWCSNRSALD